MKKLFLSIHDDDAILFAAFTCMREKPLVLTVLDSYVQPNRGEVGCDAEIRAKETEEALKVLGCEGQRLLLRDDTVDQELIELNLGFSWWKDYEVIYAPALQGGNKHHDMVSRAALNVFGRNKVIFYPTYTKSELYTTGELEVVPTEAERELKDKATACYVSQLNLPSTKPHFDAVAGKNEWLGSPQKVYLGAGKHHIDGWLHVDRHPFRNTDIVADVAAGLPFLDSSIQEIYTQDFMEHLPPESKIDVINEIWRVLKPGGRMEHYIPNAGSANDFSSPTHLSHWSLTQFEHFNVDSYRYDKDRDYEGFKGGFKQIVSETVNNEQSIHVIYEAVK